MDDIVEYIRVNNVCLINMSVDKYLVTLPSTDKYKRFTNHTTFNASVKYLIIKNPKVKFHYMKNELIFLAICSRLGYFLTVTN
jgi:hypothetical protein